MIKEAVQKDIFKGIKVGAESVVVSHLQYADDTIFLGEWDKENAKKLMCILKCFERVSGLKVNLNKSILYDVGSGSLEADGVGSRVGRSGIWRDIVKVGVDIDKVVIDFSSSFSKTLVMRRGEHFFWEDRWLIDGDGVRGFGGTRGVETLLKMKMVISRISVHVELDKRGTELDSLLCSCCDDSVELCDHNLVTCNVAKSVWDNIFEWWKISPVNVFLANDLFCLSGNVVVQSYSRVLWQLVIWTAGYYIWKERNSRVFKAKMASINKFFHEIQVKSFDWVLRRSQKASFDWQKWFIDPSSCRFQ
ncbi:reverse transcriptase domain, reverse transcriptase zinc-binding domain protein [Tanacetum coccineum]|uniref:Reverse transcriptase domain, reverse transcriptase zinc-binding domain protein n=1 Tax=Tanacetum coccineum TaxID=301880 RepID=A0ABQ5FPX7_9ASTR